MEVALSNGITHLEIRTDSKYTIQCMQIKEYYQKIQNCILDNLAATEWIRGWKKTNWIKKTDSKPVMNRDLMMKIDALQEKLQLKWVFHTIKYFYTNEISFF